MPGPSEPTPGARLTDPLAWRHITHRLQRAERAPWLHVEAGRRMAERLAVVRLQPKLVLDWWSFNGGSVAALQTAYPQARLLAVEADDSVRASSPGAKPAQPWWSARRWLAPAVAGCAESQVQPDAAELLWSNMGLHHGVDPQPCFQRWHRALKVDGFLMFSTLGPGTLTSLQSLYARAGWPPPFAPFVDMHDLGDMLVHAGFADPVMDQEMLTLTWPSAEAALAELRSLGGNAHPLRPRGLRTPRWRQHLLAALGELAGPDGRIALNFELIYGHAFKPVPRARVLTSTNIAVEDFKSMLRSPGSSK